MDEVRRRVLRISIVKRPDRDFYEARPTVDGKRYNFSGKTRAEVKNKLYDFFDNYESFKKMNSKTKLNTFIEYWLTNFKKKTLEPTSYERLVGVWEHQIKEDIGLMPLSKITYREVQYLIDIRANPLDGTKPLSRSGLRKLRDFLKPCFQRAVTEGLIRTNPCEGIIIPKERYIKVKTKKQFSLDDDQIEDFRKACLLKYTTKDEYRTRDGLVLLMMLNLGLRVGEALALEWRDINLNKDFIHIDKTIQTTKEYGLIVKDGTKTEAGERVLPINETVHFLLDEMKKYDKEHQIKCPYVCCTMDSTRKDARNLQRSLTKILRFTDITDHVTLHTLRHTFGSTLLRRGVQIEVVSRLMGHSNISVTYNKYIHVLQEQKVEALRNISIT